MFKISKRAPRTRLTGRIFLYAVAGIFGLFCVAIGASWFAAGKGVMLANFPGSAVEAVACTAGGVAVMLWAVARILREWARQAPPAIRNPRKPIDEAPA